MKEWTGQGRATIAQTATGRAGPGRAGPGQDTLARAGLYSLAYDATIQNRLLHKIA